MKTITRFIVVASLIASLSLVSAPEAEARDYTARKSGDWSSAGTWSPRGVPGQGDRVVSIGRHIVNLSGI